MTITARTERVLRCLSNVLTGLAVALPLAAWATCGGGGVSSLPLPAVTSLRSYRASFGVPTRMTVDAAGDVYVTDPGLEQIVVRAPNGRVISRVGGLGHPLSIAVGKAGIIYVGDPYSGSVTAFTPEWRPILQVGHGAGEFLQPSDLAVDTVTGDLYVADSAAHLVKVYSAAGTFLQSFGGQGSGDGQFNFPVGVFVDAVARQVLVVDQLNYRIQVFDVAGTFLSCFGAQGSGPGEFNMPQGVTVDGAGRVYVADSVEGRIQVLDRSGGFVGYIGDLGDAAGQLRIPIGMVIDPSNRLFVAAANNARLEVFGLDTFADPETVLPAVIRMEPDPIDRTTVAEHIVGYVEVPGYPLEHIVPSSIVANDVSAAPIPMEVGDHDGNGVADLRVEFDRATILATVPLDGAGSVALSGLLGTKHFEGSAVVHVTACGPATNCSLGDTDPQCNDAVCVAAVGCTIQPKPDGTGCEDGNACTVEDVCSDGACIGTPLSCDDGTVCTGDSCDAVAGCVHMRTNLRRCRSRHRARHR
jgi:DNA-binding beta-propeller fold protein YncE